MAEVKTPPAWAKSQRSDRHMPKYVSALAARILTSGAGVVNGAGEHRLC